jgi:hypothetical protein
MLENLILAVEPLPVARDKGDHPNSRRLIDLSNGVPIPPGGPPGPPSPRSLPASNIPVEWQQECQ